MGVEQGSTFSLVLSALYLVSILHLFEQQARCPENPLNVSTFLFVDDGLLISQERDYDKSLSTLKYSYNIISHLFTAVGLVLEHKKLKIFHFSRARINLNPSSRPHRHQWPYSLPRGYLEVSRLLLWQKTNLLVPYPFLCQQGSFYC